MSAVMRRARREDLGGILRVIAEARRFIALSGSDQWQDGYPEPEQIEADIEKGMGFAVENEGAIQAYCVLTAEPEPIYEQIRDSWKNKAPYITIHRMAIGDALRGKGYGHEMLRFAARYAEESNIRSLRADTHRINRTMQALLTKEGFIYRGDVLYPVTSGDPVRVAYEKTL